MDLGLGVGRCSYSRSLRVRTPSTTCCAFRQEPSRPPAEEIGLRPGGGAAGRMLDGDELEELAGMQLGQLVNAALHDHGGGVEGPDGTVVVLGKGRVEGDAVEEEIKLHLPGRPFPTIREAIEDVFQDKTVVDHDGLGTPGEEDLRQASVMALPAGGDAGASARRPLPLILIASSTTSRTAACTAFWKMSIVSSL